MTTDEIIQMAREADLFGEHGRLYQVAALTPETLARAVRATAAAKATRIGASGLRNIPVHQYQKHSRSRSQ